MTFGKDRILTVKVFVFVNTQDILSVETQQHKHEQ